MAVEAWTDRSVELRGDLTNWDPIALRPSTESRNRWTTRLDEEPGLYQVTVRVDGGEWIVPRGLLSVRDRFGGATGLLELPFSEEDGDDHDS